MGETRKRKRKGEKEEGQIVLGEATWHKYRQMYIIKEGTGKHETTKEGRK